MGPKKLVTIFALAAAITVAGITASGAMTTTKHFKAAVSLARNDPFHGHASSAFCHKNRTIKVFHQHVRGDHIFGKAKTDQVGRWAIHAHHVHGKFYARVVRVVKHRADGNKVVCDTDRSATHRY
jgi:hypothetical protein